MSNEYKENLEEYLKTTKGTKEKLTALSLTVIAAIYFFSESADTRLLKISFLFYVLTIVSEVANGFFRGRHYALWIDGKIKTVDYRESNWGKLAEYFSHSIPISLFVVGTILFTIGIF